MNKENSELEEKVKQGIYGEPEIKKEEKNRYLGEFRERVIHYLSHDQVLEEGTYPEIEEALKDKRAHTLVVDRKIELKYAHDYIKLARENNIRFKRVDSPDFKGNVGLVVVSDKAVKENNGE